MSNDLKRIFVALAGFVLIATSTWFMGEGILGVYESIGE